MASLSYDEAAHLLRRMGFGGPPEEIEGLAARGRKGAVAFLLDYGQVSNQLLEDVLAASFDFSDLFDNNRFNSGELRRWWLTRMVFTRRPFEEKLTLFWHNHFATALTKVQNQWMYLQNLTLRRHALDRFDTLLLKVAQDPAMLLWLDGVSNVFGAPNENFARELQELFTLGITDVVTGEANYTEADVKEIARAFTGWQYRIDRRQGGSAEFFINDAQHDKGVKTIYAGTPYQASGNLSGEDVITVLADRPETGRHLVRGLFEFFVYPVKRGDHKTINRFADVYQHSDHSLRAVLEALFTSDEFFSERARFALVKQPVEVVVGAIRMLGARYNPGTRERRQGAQALLSALRAMGQDIFSPPNVNGWDLNLGWVNTASMLERYNYANLLATQRPRDPDAPGVFVSPEQLKKYALASSKKTVDKFLSVLGPLKVGQPAIKNLRSYLETDDQGNPAAYTPDDDTVDKKIRGLVRQIMSLPEFQLN